MATTEEFEKARRLARAIASDISIYYGEKIQRGLENDNLFDEIAGELQPSIPEVTVVRQKSQQSEQEESP